MFPSIRKRGMKAFELVEREISPQCREVAVIGELDLAVADRLLALLDRGTDDCPKILISLAECEFIDSTGIAVVVGAYRRAGERGGQLAIYAPSAQVRRVLEVTGLTQNGLVFETAEQAQAVFADGASR
jgi:anti-sigma B factor antagonist